MAARSKSWICGRSLAGILGLNPAGSMDVSLLWVLCCQERSLRAGLITRRVECVWVWSWIVDNEEALALWGLLHHGKKKSTSLRIDSFNLWHCFCCISYCYRCESPYCPDTLINIFIVYTRPLLPGKIFAYVRDYSISSFQIEACVYTALLKLRSTRYTSTWCN